MSSVARVAVIEPLSSSVIEMIFSRIVPPLPTAPPPGRYNQYESSWASGSFHVKSVRFSSTGFQRPQILFSRTQHSDGNRDSHFDFLITLLQFMFFLFGCLICLPLEICLISKRKATLSNIFYSWSSCIAVLSAFRVPNSH